MFLGEDDGSIAIPMPTPEYTYDVSVADTGNEFNWGALAERVIPQALDIYGRVQTQSINADVAKTQARYGYRATGANLPGMPAGSSLSPRYSSLPVPGANNDMLIYGGAAALLVVAFLASQKG